MNSVKIIGILNLTPDSFSDGGALTTHEQIILRARDLINAGADLIEIGGDSSRPGSSCVGPDEEWQRIGKAVVEISSFAQVCVDTHHKEVAELALSNGAFAINDISGGTAELLEIVSKHKKKIFLMHAVSAPHDFSHLEDKKERPESTVPAIVSRLKIISDRALQAGIRREDIVLDPGMGAFISSAASQSWELIHHFNALSVLRFSLCLAVSRKGFLRGQAEESSADRDAISALAGILAVLKLGKARKVYLRVHNVALQKRWLERVLERRSGRAGEGVV